MTGAEPQTLTGEPPALPAFDDPPADPLGLLARWLEDAEARGVREPRALVLATVGTSVSSRVVLVKSVDSAGLTFTTSHDSRKGREAARDPRASGTLYWRETLQQINVTGRLVRLSDDEADRYFARRPRAAQAVAAVSEQSRPLTDEDALRARVVELRQRDTPIARPASWGGHQLVAQSIEFWAGRADRLHRRLYYERRDEGWAWRRLQP
jgi:dihydrophenazinedicarboxylate synthase